MHWMNRRFFNTNVKSTACCGTGVADVEGTSTEWSDGKVTVALKLSPATTTHTAGAAHTGNVTITLRGPADGNWFGVGFDTTSMSNSPYAIVVDGADGNVSEHVLGSHIAGITLASSVDVVSNMVTDGFRTVVVTRGLTGISPEYV